MEPAEDGGWRHAEIRLEPEMTAAGYQPIILRGVSEDSIQVIAELVEVLPGRSDSR